ncbi:tyrosine-type recombinase/integrase [Leucobacter chromiiresistens]|uniref:tyrosine-type recombinase/integrase n=1 Tax=Leucobacter chromiiresistens TaxID=1079994 RepID=UPI000B285F3B|nr:tyrosine-type recombinase/integrase [Leucobacter chromiiresistens]
MNSTELLAEYRLHLLRLGRSPGTLKQRLGDLSRLHAHAGPLEDITKTVLEQHLDLHSAEWSPAYRKKVYASYRSFFQWARKRKLIAQNPSRGLETVRVPRYLPRPAPEDVVLDAFDKASTVEAAMLCLGATQGLRRSEIAAAHPAQRDGMSLRVIGKGSKERLVPLDPLTLSLLEQLESEQGCDDYYFRGRFGGHVHPATVYKWLKQHLGTGWSTHNLRHRAASHGLRETHDLRGVQELLGHASLATTQIYTEVSTEQLTSIVTANSLRTKVIERRLSQTLLNTNVPATVTDADVQQAMRVLAHHLSLVQDG